MSLNALDSVLASVYTVRVAIDREAASGDLVYSVQMGNDWVVERSLEEFARRIVAECVRQKTRIAVSVPPPAEVMTSAATFAHTPTSRKQWNSVSIPNQGKFPFDI